MKLSINNIGDSTLRFENSETGEKMECCFNENEMYGCNEMDAEEVIEFSYENVITSFDDVENDDEVRNTIADVINQYRTEDGKIKVR